MAKDESASKAVIPARFQPPALATVTKIEKVAGKNIEKVNLRDHPELSGMNVIVVKAAINNEGSPEYGGRPFIVAQAFIYPPHRDATAEDVRVMVTGSGNVFDRLSDALLQNALPVAGVLRKSGRAWFID